MYMTYCSPTCQTAPPSLNAGDRKASASTRPASPDTVMQRCMEEATADAPYKLKALVATEEVSGEAAWFEPFVFLAKAPDHAMRKASVDIDGPKAAVIDNAPLTTAAATVEDRLRLQEPVKQAMLWAARLCVPADRLQSVIGATIGIPKCKSSTLISSIIDSDKFRMAAQLKRSSVQQETPPARKSTTPGEVYIGDGWGPVGVKCAVTGGTYELSLACEACGVEFDASVKVHTIPEWIAFIAHVQAVGRRHGREMRVIRFDAGGELRGPAFKAQLEQELGITVEIAPGGGHESIGLKEASQDPVTRMSEAMLSRAGGAGDRFVLMGRRHARWLRNMAPPKGKGPSRWHSFTGKPVDLASAPTPLVWGCDVIVLNDEKQRSQKGSGQANRAADGMWIGIDGASNVVLKSNGQTVRRINVKPLNEQSLALSGLPGGTLTEDVLVQTEGNNLGSHPPLQPKIVQVKVPAQVELHPRVEGIDIGMRVEVWYLPVKRGGKKVLAEAHEQAQWFGGVVTATRDLSSGARHHLVAWEDAWEGEFDWLDLANNVRVWRKEQAVGKSHKLRVKQAPATKAGAKGKEQAAQAAPAPPRTRSTSKAARAAKRGEQKVAVVAMFAAQTLTALGGDYRDAFAEQYLGCSADEAFVPGTLCSLSASVRQRVASSGNELARVARSATQFVAAKAAHGPLEFVDEAGNRVERKPPANEKERKTLPDAELWKMAFDKAVAVLENAPGNYWIEYDEATANDWTVTEGVLSTKFKKDPVTGKLEDNNGRKARIAFNNPVAEAIDEKKGQRDDMPFSAPVAGDLQKAIMLSDACERQRGLTKADVGNAFLLGTRGGQIGLGALRERRAVIVRMPKGCRRYTPEGKELVLVCIAPIWGEKAAGFEWHVKLVGLLEDDHWQRCPEAPCMWYKVTHDGHDARMLTIVDDLLISEDSMRHEIAAQTVAYLRKKCGGKVTMEIEPTFYAGEVIERTFDPVSGRDTLARSMTEKIADGVFEEAPEIVEGKPPPLKGKKLIEALKALQLPPKEERSKKLSKEGKRYASITGKLRWYLRILTGLNWMVHRLSKVVSCPPEGAIDVAISVLTLAYHARGQRVVYTQGLPSASGMLKGALGATIQQGDTAPADLLAISDATWGINVQGPWACDDVYGFVLTRTGGKVHATTHDLGIVVDASSYAEAIGTSKAGETVDEARAIETALGIPPTAPTIVLTVPTRSSAAARARCGRATRCAATCRSSNAWSRPCARSGSSRTPRTPPTASPRRSRTPST